MKYLSTSILLTLFVAFTSAQGYSQEAIATSGGEAIGNGQASYSIGQVSYTTIFSQNGSAYAYQGVQIPFEAYAPVGECVEDINDDGFINGADLVILLSAFGGMCADCASDLNGDTFINGADLVIFLAAFGGIC